MINQTGNWDVQRCNLFGASSTCCHTEPRTNSIFALQQTQAFDGKYLSECITFQMRLGFHATNNFLSIVPLHTQKSARKFIRDTKAILFARGRENFIQARANQGGVGPSISGISTNSTWQCSEWSRHGLWSCSKRISMLDPDLRRVPGT